MVGGEMKFFDTNQTGNGEGKPLCTSTFLSFKIEYKQKKIEFFCVEVLGKNLFFFYLNSKYYN